MTPQKLILRSAVLIDGTGALAVKNAEVLVEDGFIRGVGKSGEYPATDCKIVDFGQSTILPGLIDTHVHLQFDAGKTTEGIIRRQVAATDAQLAMRALSHAQSALASGVTTLRDCGGRMALNVPVREAIDSGRSPGPRLLVSGAPITTTSGHLHWCGLTADSEDEVRVAVRRMVVAGADFIKVMATGGGMTPISNLKRPQYTLKTLAALVEDANRLNKRVAAHTLGADGCEYAIDAGVHTFEHFRWTGDNGMDYRPDAIDRMNPETQSINATYTGFDRGRFDGPDSLDAVPSELIEGLRDEYAFYRDAESRGVSVTSSSDAGVANVDFADFALSVIAGMVALDDTPEGAIRRATSAQAKTLGLESEIGSIKPGMRADLLVVEGDASKNIFALRNPKCVYQDGVEVAKAGRLLTMRASDSVRDCD